MAAASRISSPPRQVRLQGGDHQVFRTLPGGTRQLLVLMREGCRQGDLCLRADHAGIPFPSSWYAAPGHTSGSCSPCVRIPMDARSRSSRSTVQAQYLSPTESPTIGWSAGPTDHGRREPTSAQPSGPSCRWAHRSGVLWQIASARSALTPGAAICYRPANLGSPLLPPDPPQAALPPPFH